MSWQQVCDKVFAGLFKYKTVILVKQVTSMGNGRKTISHLIITHFHDFFPWCEYVRSKQKFTNLANNYDPRQGGHLDLQWSPITQLWVNVRPFVPDFVYAIFRSFSPMDFKFKDMETMDKTLIWLTFRDRGSFVKVTGGILFQN